MKRHLLRTWLLPPLLSALLAAPCAAESTLTVESVPSGNSAQARLRFTIRIPPVFKVLEARPAPDNQTEYRVWTNMPTFNFQGRSFRIYQAGETTIRVPANRSAVLVHGL